MRRKGSSISSSCQVNNTFGLTPGACRGIYILPAPNSAVANDSTTLLTCVFLSELWVMEFKDRNQYRGEPVAFWSCELPPKLCCNDDTAYASCRYYLYSLKFTIYIRYLSFCWYIVFVHEPTVHSTHLSHKLIKQSSQPLLSYKINNPSGITYILLPSKRVNINKYAFNQYTAFVSFT